VPLFEELTQEVEISGIFKLRNVFANLLIIDEELVKAKVIPYTSALVLIACIV